MGLSPSEAATVYDRIGRLQDTQRVFEAPALARLTADGRLADARSVVEVGCGTGRFARELLAEVCGPECRYLGLDVSRRMCRIATARLSPWPDRARVMWYDGSLPLPLPAACADRVVAAFLMDLLPTSYGRELLADAHRILAPGGLLCLASLAPRHDAGQPRVLHRLEQPRATRSRAVGWVPAGGPGRPAGARPLDGAHRRHRDHPRLPGGCPGGRASGIGGLPWPG